MSNPKWKLPDLPGFSALIESLKNAKKTSDAAASGVSGLQEDIQGLAKNTTATFAQVNTALGDMDAEKQDKGGPIPVTIPTQGWTQDSAAQEAFPLRCELAVAGITAKDRADITIAPAGQGTAYSCGLCRTSETQEGKIIIWSATIPAEAIPAEIWLHQGKE